MKTMVVCGRIVKENGVIRPEKQTVSGPDDVAGWPWGVSVMAHLWQQRQGK
jgi:hypothetical protein